MKGKLFIDGVDAFEAYGASVSAGWYSDIACLPPLKAVEYNDWHEKDGIDPDLSSPVLDSKSVQMNFHVTGDISKVQAFVGALSGVSYHMFGFEEIGRPVKMRLVSFDSIESTGDLHEISLTFADDFELDDYSYTPPASALSRRGDYFLGGTDMAAYGIRILEGSLDSIAAYPSVKENLLVDIPSYKGVVYDDSLVKFATRTALLKCHMKAESLEAFWRNRDAFLYDITAPRAYDSSIENDDICSLGKKTLYVTPLGKGVDFFYKDCSVGSFFCDAGAVWFDFTLSLEFFKGVI